MTAPNACVAGLVNPPGQDPAAITALASGWRAEAAKLGSAANATGNLSNDTSDWQGTAASAFHTLVPQFVDAINKAGTRMTTLATDLDKFAHDLDDLQGHPGDGRTDTWWGLSNALTQEGQAIQALQSRIQAAINTPVLTQQGAYIPPWPKGISLPSDGNSIADGTTTKALSDWECNQWITWSHLDGLFAAELTKVSTLRSQLNAYTDRVNAFKTAAASYFDNVTNDAAAHGALSALGNIKPVSLMPLKTDPPIPMSEVQSYQVTVQNGDNLSVIAASAYGVQNWQRVYNDNKGVVGGNPNLIYAGQTLTINDPTAGTLPAGADTGTIYGTPPAPPQPQSNPRPQSTPALYSAVNAIVTNNACTSLTQEQYDAIKAYFASGPQAVIPYSNEANATLVNWAYSHGILIGPPSHYVPYPTGPNGQ